MHIDPPVKRLTPHVDMSRERMEFHIRHGRKLRAEAFSAFFHSLFSRTEAAAGAANAQTAETDTDPGKFKNSLTAIRCAAELLRDNPGIALAERQRFIDIVLKEEERLERLVGRGLTAAG